MILQPLSELKKYAEIITDQRCQRIIEREAGKVKASLTAPEFLQFAQLVLPGRLPLSALASISGKVGAKLGAGREEFGFRVYHHPFACVVLAHIVSLARHSMTIKKVEEVEGHCLIESHIPSTIWNLEGRLETLIIAEGSKTKIMMQAKIFGQWFDLGKTERLIEQLLLDMERLSARFSRDAELRKGGIVAPTV